jgi:hypothetical protein
MAYNVAKPIIALSEEDYADAEALRKVFDSARRALRGKPPRQPNWTQLQRTTLTRTNQLKSASLTLAARIVSADLESWGMANALASLEENDPAVWDEYLEKVVALYPAVWILEQERSNPHADRGTLELMAPLQF